MNEENNDQLNLEADDGKDGPSNAQHSDPQTVTGIVSCGDLSHSGNFSPPIHEVPPLEQHPQNMHTELLVSTEHLVSLEDDVLQTSNSDDVSKQEALNQRCCPHACRPGSPPPDKCCYDRCRPTWTIEQRRKNYGDDYQVYVEALIKHKCLLAVDVKIEI